jgi:hypothetical protein
MIIFISKIMVMEYLVLFLHNNNYFIQYIFQKKVILSSNNVNQEIKNINTIYNIDDSSIRK